MELYGRPRCGIRSLMAKFAILQTLAYYVSPNVYSSLNAPRECFETAPERFNVLSVGAKSEEQPLTQEPSHLSLGTGLYLINDRRDRGASVVRSCLGRRKRIEKNVDLSLQVRPVEPSDSAYIWNRPRKLIHENPSWIRDRESQKTVVKQGTNRQYDGLPSYLVAYFTSTQPPGDEYSSTLDNQVQEREIVHLRMSEYMDHKKRYVMFPAENDDSRRQRCIAEANDRLGSQEITNLDLHTKEIKLAKDLLGMELLGDLHSWGPIRFRSAVVDAIRSVRTTLYRIRKLDEMCRPPLFDTLEARKDAQKKAFELLKIFWTTHTFPAIARKEARYTILDAKPGSLKALVRLARRNISSRSQTPAEKTSLSWVVFKYWAKENLCTISRELCIKLGLVTQKLKSPEGSMSRGLKIYLADHAVAEAQEKRMINYQYQVQITALFKLGR